MPFLARFRLFLEKLSVDLNNIWWIYPKYIVDL